MIVDCGGGTVDLTTRKLVDENILSEITERAGDYCGSSFIDEEFLKYIGGIVGHSAIDKLRDKKSKSLQYMVQHFCQRAKFQFTGEDINFMYELDILDIIRVLKNYVEDQFIGELERDQWLIPIDFNKIKSMFDPIVEKIIKMIEIQLENCGECSIMFLVGGFGQSKYLKKRIVEKFQDRVNTIVVPNDPVAAIVRGAVIYGLSLSNQLYNLRGNEDVIFILKDRKLKFTYGIKVLELFKEGDPPERKKYGRFIEKFHRIAKRGDVVEIDKEIIVNNLYPLGEVSVIYYIYFTSKDGANYCDETGMELLGTLKIDLAEDPDKCMSFELSFGRMELTATARNEANGRNYFATFEIDKEIN